MKMNEAYIAQLQNLLRENADPKTKEWWEGYVKQSAPFLGVKMAAIRSSVHGWHKEFVADQLDAEQQIELALALFYERYTEEKLAGTLCMQEILLPTGVIRCERVVNRFSELFSEGGIYDWNVCDWFCIKVLGPLMQGEGEPCANRVSEWRTAENLWQARASLVAFVNLAAESAYFPLIEESCRTLIRREERFAKTAVGWILREVSKHDGVFVRRVIVENLEHFSTESLRNATKYFSKDKQKAYISRLKKA